MERSSLQRTILEFRQTYEEFVSKGEVEMRVSDLRPRDQAEWTKRDAELHPSSFPFCGLRSAYERLIRDPDPVINLDFGRDYYLPAGHVFHSAVQKWIGMSGKMIGDWRCYSCKATRTLRAMPEKPCKCGVFDWEYRELGGTWGKNIHWHSDGVFRKNNGKYWIVDYKTTSSYGIDEHRKTKSVFPYQANRAQIESYIVMIEENYGIEIEGWLLVYCARDSPGSMYKVEVVGSEMPADRKEAVRERALQADKDYGITHKVHDKPIAVFKRLTETKLCEDRDFYDHFVKDKYNPCPLAKVCFNKEKRQAFLSAAVSKVKASK